MLENMGHRAESILEKTFEDLTDDANLWQRFIRHEKTHPGRARWVMSTLHRTVTETTTGIIHPLFRVNVTIGYITSHISKALRARSQLQSGVTAIPVNIINGG